MPIECDVYKSLRHEYMYLYVNQREGLARVPEELLARFGDHELALSFTLTADRTLAREDPARVKANLDVQGYHLQMPPADKDLPVHK